MSMYCGREFPSALDIPSCMDYIQSNAWAAGTAKHHDCPLQKLSQEILFRVC